MEPGRAGALFLVGAADLLFAGLTYKLPWQRWSERATLAVVAPGIAVIAAAHKLDLIPVRSYGVFFVLLFAWIGIHHPPLTAVKLAPVMAAGYSLPIVLARSKCGTCGATLTARDLVPIASWLARRGRCRCGKVALGAFYPGIELAALAVALSAATVLSDHVSGDELLLLRTREEKRKRRLERVEYPGHAADSTSADEASPARILGL